MLTEHISSCDDYSVVGVEYLDYGWTLTSISAVVGDARPTTILPCVKSIPRDSSSVWEWRPSAVHDHTPSLITMATLLEVVDQVLCGHSSDCQSQPSHVFLDFVSRPCIYLKNCSNLT